MSEQTAKPIHRVYKNGILYGLDVETDKWEVLALDKPDSDIDTVKAHAINVLANHLAESQLELGYYSASQCWPEGLKSDDMSDEARVHYISKATRMLGWD